MKTAVLTDFGNMRPGDNWHTFALHDAANICLSKDRRDGYLSAPFGVQQIDAKEEG